MRFTKLVAILAMTGLASSASAYSDGTLRRSNTLAQADTTELNNKAVNININTNSSMPAQQPQAQVQTVTQPATVVEASPVAESKAEGLRKARVEAEVQTEQKIVEKLEDARLREERERADRLFGNKFDAAPVAPAAAVVVATPTPAPTPAPIVAAPEKKEPQQPAQVTIEKVEIVQPAAPVKEAVVNDTSVETSKMSVAKTDDQSEVKARYYVSGLAGNLNYNASNVKSNYGLGVAVGTIVQERWALELSYMYSNHYVDTFWQAPLYRNLDQSDITAAAKYYLLGGKLKPYVGGSVSYINRKYSDRIQNGYYWMANQYTTSDTTQAVDMGVLAGVDFAINDQFIVGGGLAYNFNVMNTNPINYNVYGLPANTQQLETMSFYVITLNAKFLF